MMDTEVWAKFDFAHFLFAQMHKASGNAKRRTVPTGTVPNYYPIKLLCTFQETKHNPQPMHKPQEKAPEESYILSMHIPYISALLQ